MSTTDPRRNDDGTFDEPATAVSADAADRRRNDTETTDRGFDDVVSPDRNESDADRGRHSADATPDGAIRDSESTSSTRVLPAPSDEQLAEERRNEERRAEEHRNEERRAEERAAEERRAEERRAEERRAADDRPTVVAPVVPPAERTAETRAEHPMNPRSVLEREREQFGGMRFLLAFFGWLTATGLAVLLGAIAGGIFTAVGSSNGATATTSGLQSLGLAGAIVTAVILFVAYYAGGYVAGRMARFDGAKQGVAVWLWAILITILAAIAGAIGSQFGLFSQVGSIAQVPINGQTLTAVGIVGIIAALVLSLLGAVLGGLAGMRFHRKVDRAAFGA